MHLAVTSAPKRWIPLLLAVAAGLFLQACGDEKALTDPSVDVAQDELTNRAFFAWRPLTLDKSTVSSGDILTGTVTYKNTTTRTLTIRAVGITSRPPGGTNAGGPYEDFTPFLANVKVLPGRTVTVTATRTFTDADRTGSWYAFSTYQSSDGLWHDSSSNVSFTVASSSPGCTPATCAKLGKDCGTVADGCGGTLVCGSCVFPKTCGGGGIANVCGQATSGADAGTSGGTDAGTSGGTDAGTSGGTDAGTSGGTDAGTSGGTDAGTSGGSDAGTSGGTDAGSGGTDAGSGGTTDAVLALRVSGNKLVNARGQATYLRGMNRAGTEYACVQNWGIFDGPSDEASVQAMASWHPTSVRVLLNEDCWLGINGVNSAYSGANYQRAIADYVRLLNKYGMYAEITLMWSAPGTQLPTSNPQMPDADHAPAFWASVANFFKGNPGVFFDLLNEPHDVSWSCWKNGGSQCSLGFQVAGMQQLVTAIRNTGATQVISVPGINYSNDLTGWLANKPSDPLNQLMAEAHVYGGNACQSTSCFDSQMKPVAQSVPVLWGEVGEHYDGSHCGSTNMSQFLPWAYANGVGYQAWTWNTWGDCLSLISDYQGTVNSRSSHASYVKSHLASIASAP